MDEPRRTGIKPVADESMTLIFEIRGRTGFRLVVGSIGCMSWYERQSTLKTALNA